jgi:predicted nuclease with TOPRIM domain
MTDEQLLDQLDRLIQRRLEENNTQFREELRAEIEIEAKKSRADLLAKWMELRGSVHDVHDGLKELQIDQAHLHERLDAQREQTNRVEKNLSEQISREAKDLAAIFTDGVFPKLAEHDEQIAELQEEIGLKPRKH